MSGFDGDEFDLRYNCPIPSLADIKGELRTLDQLQAQVQKHMVEISGQNGVYSITQTGRASTPWILIRDTLASCRACGAKNDSHCDRWDCPTLVKE